MSRQPFSAFSSVGEVWVLILIVMLTQPLTELELELGLSLAIFLMTSHLYSHTTTDIKPEMISSVQNGNGIPHNEYNTRGIAHGRRNRKDDILNQR